MDMGTDYTEKDSAPEESANELREPMAAYAVRGPAVREPWLDSGEDEGFDLDGDDDDPPPAGYDNWVEWQLEHDPEFAAEFERKADESDLAIKEGRVKSHDEVMRRLQWRIDNNQWDDVIERMRKNGRI
jgi:hypothetical protein